MYCLIVLLLKLLCHGERYSLNVTNTFPSLHSFGHRCFFQSNGKSGNSAHLCICLQCIWLELEQFGYFYKICLLGNTFIKDWNLNELNSLSFDQLLLIPFPIRFFLSSLNFKICFLLLTDPYGFVRYPKWTNHYTISAFLFKSVYSPQLRFLWTKAPWKHGKCVIYINTCGFQISHICHLWQGERKNIDI